MRFRDHYPANNDTRSAMRDAYGETRDLYLKVFGHVDVQYWPEQDDTCGDSYSGFIPTKSEVSKS
ncbi:hypothetical protein [Risungbinella massiliensis]|uniref:hypothetical protein n=1 Tax=Risungbinella massiliensis TaxID=1329796 RepID=UPI0005CC1C7E|nr:hypothetical protein [Risungbinella massiliensis]